MPQKHIISKSDVHYSVDHIWHMPAITEAKRVQERDLTAQLRGLVDGCFEEGQYDAGLAALDQLRSSNYRPAP